MLWTKAWKAIFNVERRQTQEVWAVALIIRMLDVSDAVSFFRCALNVKLLSRITPRRRGVVLTRTFGLPIKIVGFQELLFDQVEKGHTSLFSAFKFNFHSWAAGLLDYWLGRSFSIFLFTSCSKDRDVISKEGNNCIVVECRGQIVNVEQEE